MRTTARICQLQAEKRRIEAEIRFLANLEFTEGNVRIDRIDYGCQEGLWRLMIQPVSVDPDAVKRARNCYTAAESICRKRIADYIPFLIDNLSAARERILEVPDDPV
ncbi:MAG: hypothetical protein J6Y20_03735 [Lachnospiraceae bacterium]|nr:hypothetical protein [Lachnospiraceae bacterium]